MANFILVRDPAGREKATKAYPNDFIDGGTTYDTGAGAERIKQLREEAEKRKAGGDTRAILVDTGPELFSPGEVLLVWSPTEIGPKDKDWAAQSGVKTLTSKALLPSDVY